MVSTTSKPKSTKLKKSTEICHHYEQGNCTRGDQCRYVHPDGLDIKKANRKRSGLQGRQKYKDWLRYGAKLDNVLSVVQNDIGLVFLDAPVCTGHQVKCAKRKVDKPSAKRYGQEYWCCHKVVTGQAKDNCGFFRWVEDEIRRRQKEMGENGESAEGDGDGRLSKRRKFEDDDEEEESSSSESDD